MLGISGGDVIHIGLGMGRGTMTEKCKPNKHFTHAEGVSLKEFIECRIEGMERAVTLARQLMEDRMAGFPNMFVQKGDTDVAIAQLAADLKAINETIGDIKTIALPRNEFSMQHGMLADKINALEKKTIGLDKIAADLIGIEKRTQGVELLKAEITGKIWTLGVVVTIMVVVLEFLMHYVFGIHK
jgi:hypothetical protein